METIGQTPRQRTANEPQRGCRAQHQAELLGRKPVFGKKGGQERRGKSERTEKGGIERHKSNECAALSHGPMGSLRVLAFGWAPQWQWRRDTDLDVLASVGASGFQDMYATRQSERARLRVESLL